MTNSLNAPETKAHSPEAHAEHDRMMQIFESFREANDERFAEIEKRMSGDVLSEEKVDRIAKALDIMYNEEGHTIVGKDAYLSPEQARREITDARADLFACGIVLTEILFLYNMFESEDDDPSSTRENIRSMEVSDFREYREDIDEGLNKILLRALAKDRDERFQTATEMLEKLERYILPKWSISYQNGKWRVYTDIKGGAD